MSSLRMIISLWLAMGLLCCCSACVPQQHSSRVFQDFASFKENHLQLPEKQDTLCLVAVVDIMLSRYVA